MNEKFAELQNVLAKKIKIVDKQKDFVLTFDSLFFFIKWQYHQQVNLLEEANNGAKKFQEEINLLNSSQESS